MVQVNFMSFGLFHFLHQYFPMPFLSLGEMLILGPDALKDNHNYGVQVLQ